MLESPRGKRWVAVGKIHGWRKIQRTIPGPDGAGQHESKQIPFVEIYSRLHQQFPIFFLEIHSAVMFLLPRDVFNQAIKFALRMRECRVSLLPIREHRKNGMFFDPVGCACLNVLDQVGETHGEMKAGEDVHVVLNTTDAIKVALSVFQDAPDIAEKLFATGCLQNGLTALGGKHDVIRDCGEGGHGLIVPPSTPSGLGDFARPSDPQVKTCGYRQFTAPRCVRWRTRCSRIVVGA